MCEVSERMYEYARMPVYVRPFLFGFVRLPFLIRVTLFGNKQQVSSASLVSITRLQNVLFVFLPFHFLIRPLYQLHPKTSHSSSNSTVLFQLAPHDLSHSSVFPLQIHLCPIFFFTSCTCIYVFRCAQAIAR